MGTLIEIGQLLLTVAFGFVWLALVIGVLVFASRAIEPLDELLDHFREVLQTREASHYREERHPVDEEFEVRPPGKD